MAKKQKVDPEEMSFLDHLEELRWHIIRSVIAILILAVGAFLAKDFIFNTIIFGPKDPNFVTYRVLCHVAQFFGMNDSFCLTEIPFRIQSRTMSGQFNAHMWTAITAGFIVAFPYIIYEFWRFISPGLSEIERKASRGFILIASILFFIGVLFGYYIVSPLSINFLGSYRVSNQVFNDIDLSSYMGLVRSAALASGVVFELPIFIYLLTKMGLITPDALRKSRKFALVGILVVSAIITPPDITSQVIVAIPVLLLYEISIYISKIVLKNQEKKRLAEEKGLTKR